METRLEGVNYEHAGSSTRGVNFLAFFIWPFFDVNRATDFARKVQKTHEAYGKKCPRIAQKNVRTENPKSDSSSFFCRFLGA